MSEIDNIYNVIFADGDISLTVSSLVLFVSLVVCCRGLQEGETKLNFVVKGKDK